MKKTRTIQYLHELKKKKEKISCLTAYDATFSALLSECEIDVILVGDSLGCVIQGQTTTIPVTMEDMVYHTRCVSQGNKNAFLIADLPFMSYATFEIALINATKLMQAGAHCIKVEGGIWLLEIVEGLTERGIPVCAHLGLTPQSVHHLGGYKVQGKSHETALRILNDARLLEQKGAILIVLECVPFNLAKEISETLYIPTIGIGAGPYCDGQVLVLYDMLGLNNKFNLKFSKDFLAQSDTKDLKGAVKAYARAVKSGLFPTIENSFTDESSCNNPGY